MVFFAENDVADYLNGRRGLPLQCQIPEIWPKTLTNQVFAIAEVTGGAAVRAKGTRLLVCENLDDNRFFHVWKRDNKIGGIYKTSCAVIEGGLDLNAALIKMGRKPYPHTEI